METPITERQARLFHPEVSWDHVETPGFYVSRATGNTYHVLAEALIKGASCVIQQVSAHPKRLAQLVRDLFHVECSRTVALRRLLAIPQKKAR